MMNGESMHTELRWDSEHPGYGVVVLLYSYYIPVKRHGPQVIEAFWTDDTYHMVAFHDAQDAWKYIELAQRDAIDEYLPSETYARYRTWEKEQLAKKK